MGLVDLIRKAASEEEIVGLVEAGNKNYKLVSPKTKRRWGYVAQRRLNEFRLVKEKKAVKASAEPDSKKPEDKAKRQKVPGRKPYKSKKS